MAAERAIRHDELRDRLAEAEQALRFYADEENWKRRYAPGGWFLRTKEVLIDRGQRARVVLAQLREGRDDG